MEWLRLHNSTIDDSKVMLMSETFRWRYIALLCVSSAQEERGTLPDDEEIVFKLRITNAQWKKTLAEFLKRGLVDQDGDVLYLHGWHKRQYVSDNSTGRVRKHRENAEKKPQDETLPKRYNDVSATPPDTDTDTDTDTDKNILPPPENCPPAAANKKQCRTTIPSTFNRGPTTLNIMIRDELQALLQGHPAREDILKPPGKWPDDVLDLYHLYVRLRHTQIGGSIIATAAPKAMKALMDDTWYREKKINDVFWLLDVAGDGRRAVSRVRKFSAIETGLNKEMAERYKQMQERAKK